MRNPHGYAYARDRFSGKEEGADTYTCSHCNSIYEVPHGKQPESFCTDCDQFICQKPACHDGCTPYIKRVEAAEKKFYARQAFMKAAGID